MVASMTIKPKNDFAIFFKLPTAVVDQIENAAYDLGFTRTQFIRQAIFRTLTAFLHQEQGNKRKP
jgi:hypothetical protein